MGMASCVVPLPSLPAAIAPQLLLLPVAAAAVAAVLLLQIAAGNHSACCMQINASTSDCSAGRGMPAYTHSYMRISHSPSLALSLTLSFSFSLSFSAPFYELLQKAALQNLHFQQE